VPPVQRLAYIGRMKLSCSHFIFRCRAVSLAVAGAAFAAELAVSVCCPAAAQQPMDSMNNMGDMQSVPAPEQLPVPVRMTGIGNSHIQIKASAETQAWFDQGLSLLHDFWNYESAKAFEQAIRVDPNCAMCWWGLAQAEDMRSSDTKLYAKKALAKAIELKSHAGAAGKLYIEAAQADADAKGEDRSREIAILRKLVSKNPRDIEARIFLAGAVETATTTRASRKPVRRSGSRFSRAPCATRPMTPPQTTTGFMRWNRGIIPRWR